MSLFWPWPGSRIKNSKAFTLVEILVAMLILSLIVIMVAQIFSGSTMLISQNNKSMDALDVAQVVFQQIGLDVSRMMLRDDIDYSFVKKSAGTTGNLAGNDVLSFYARTTGLLTSTGTPPSGTPRLLSAVGYKIKTNSQNKLEFDYGALQVDWQIPSSTTGSVAFATSSFVNGLQTQLFTWQNTLPNPDTSPDVIPYTTLAPEVIRFEYLFVLKSDPNHTPPQYLFVPSPAGAPTNPLPNLAGNPNSATPQINPLVNLENVTALIVGIVAIDPKNRLLLPGGTDVKLAQLFPDAVPNQDLLSLWTPIVNNAVKLEGAGVPAQAVGGIHVYQKYFPIPW